MTTRFGIAVGTPILLLGLLFVGGPAVGQVVAPTTPGASIVNTAQVSFAAGDRDDRVAVSNTVALTVASPATNAVLELMRIAAPTRGAVAFPVAPTDYSASGLPEGPWLALPPPREGDDPIDLGTPVPLVAGDRFRQGEAVFLSVEDADQNRDAGVRETVLVEVFQAANGDRELLRLLETEPASGIFTGYLQSDRNTAMQTRDGLFSVEPGAPIRAEYVDVQDATDRAEATGVFDPLCRVFDSRSGEPIDGARITLLESTTGLPARVLGDDGVSAFPASITTGRSLLDDGGISYDLDDGTYRFPRVQPGEYILQVEAPPGYLAPSRLAIDALRDVPGSPYQLHAEASYGAPFLYSGEEPLRVDVPLDVLNTDLFVTKAAAKPSAAIGDFVEYLVTVQNRSDDDAEDLTLYDELPAGFRYRSGSTRRGEEAFADPSVSPDGRTLGWTVPELAAGDEIQVRYVTEVVPGARAGEAVNRAWARWAQIRSMTASARVRVVPDLFGETCTLLGRVTTSRCPGDSLSTAGTDTLATQGIAGVRILLESGAFAVTDAQGRYHLSGILPGAHVVQMDLATLPARYAAGARSPDPHKAEHPYARILDLQGGTVWRTDFEVHLRPPTEGNIALDLATTLERDRLTARIELGGAGVPLRNVRLTALLPDGVRYEPGTSRLDTLPIADPENHGSVLVWRLGDVQGDWAQRLDFGARADSTSTRSSLELQALAVFDSPQQRNCRTEPARTIVNLVPETRHIRQPEMVLHPQFPSLSAELSAEDRARIDSLATRLEGLEISSIQVTGHSDSQRIRPGAHPVYTDNRVLSLARAHAVGDYLAAHLGLDPGQMSVQGMGPSQPIADNSTVEGRARNRRVSLQVMSERTLHVLPEEPVRDHHRQQLELKGLRPGEDWPSAENSTDDLPPAAPVFDAAWLAAASPGRSILWPTEGHLPPLPTLKIAVLHLPGDQVVVRLNGAAVGPLAWAGTEVSPNGNTALSRWNGVDLVEGDNALEITWYDGTGGVVEREQRSIHYSGPPVYAEWVPALSRLVADGKTPPEIAVRLKDAQGYPAREGVVGQYSVGAPFLALRDRNAEDRRSLSGLQDRRPSYLVEAGGIARLRLEPTSQAGEALVTLPLLDHEEEMRVWLKPQDRDWVLVGLAAGTAGYAQVSGNLETFRAADGDDGFYRENRLAFFAKGRLKGTWLATMAYDSRKPGAGPETNLFAAIDPDAYYTVYADAVTEGQEAPSAEKLYVKLEREQFYALFGDFQTGLTVTELSRYQRTLTGVKSELQRGNLGYTAFASRTHHAYLRDEIRGDGTSGLYRLSRQQIVTHSEKITLEVRDRFRSEIVHSQRTLTRFIDYEIDYAAGTIHFKEPVTSQDQDLNPRWIVAEYETWDENQSAVSVGGRAHVRPRGGPVEAGATGIREGDTGPGGGDLLGLDLRWDLGPATRWKTEAAWTNTDAEGEHQAFWSELSRHAGTLQGRAYFRELESGFGLGQIRGGQVGTRKLGAEGSWRLRQSMRTDVVLYRLDNLVAAAERRVAEMKWSWQSRRLRTNLGLRHAGDSLAGGHENISNQLVTGTSLQLWQHRLRLQAGREQSLGSNDNNPDFPTRSTLGVEFEALRNQTLFATQEWVHGQPADRSSLRLGMKTAPWTGAQFLTSRQDEMTEAGRRVFSNLGMKQTWRINEAWSVDGGLDHGWSDGSRAASDSAATSPFATTASSGSEDFTAVSLGAAWRGKSWLWDQRAEYRNSWDEDKWGLYGGLFVEPTAATGLLASLKLQGNDRRDGGHQTHLDLGLGWAWRPQESPWLLLQKFNFRTQDVRDAVFAGENWRIVQNANLTWRHSRWLQISGMYGARYQREFLSGRRYDSFTDRTGLEARTFFRRRWDAAVHANWLHGWGSGVGRWNSGASCGYRLLEDVWLSLGYNFAGFVDHDLTAGEYTAHGPYLRFRIRFNQESTRAMLH